jgi:hypothetical protein
MSSIAMPRRSISGANPVTRRSSFAALARTAPWRLLSTGTLRALDENARRDARWRAMRVPALTALLAAALVASALLARSCGGR